MNLNKNGGECMTYVITIILVFLFSIIGIVVGRKIANDSNQRNMEASRTTAEHIKADALKDAESLKKEALLEAKEENQRYRTETENELRERRFDLKTKESRLLQREEILDRKAETLDNKEESLESKEEKNCSETTTN